MFRRLGSVVLLLAIALVASQAAGPPVPEYPSAVAVLKALMELAKKDSNIMANLTHLSDVIGPRLTGSAALVKANEWTADKMRAYGLVNVGLEPYTIPEGWERGKATARLIEPGTGRNINIASMGWYPGTKGKITGEVVVIKAETVADLEKYKGKLKNAIILQSPPAKLPHHSDLNKVGAAKGGRPGFGMRSEEFMEMQQTLQDMMTKEGAAAIFMDSGKPLGLLVTTGNWGGRMGMGGKGEDKAKGGGDRASAANRMPRVYVAHNDYELLYRLGTRADGPRPKLELEIENKFIPGPIKVYNTVGEIRGSERPEEFVVVGAHLDSWDLGTGTTDNGTGSSIVLETARILAKCGVKPKRTIRFVLFTGEEQGLHGSREYTLKHKDEMPRTAAALIHDTGTGSVKGIGVGGRQIHAQILERELASLKALGVTDFKSGGGGGSDHMSFSRVGVPGFLMVQDPAGYTYTHHTQADTLDSAKEPDLIQGAQVLTVAAMRIANMEKLLPRIEQPKGKQRGGF